MGAINGVMDCGIGEESPGAIAGPQTLGSRRGWDRGGGGKIGLAMEVAFQVRRPATADGVGRRHGDGGQFRHLIGAELRCGERDHPRGHHVRLAQAGRAHRGGDGGQAGGPLLPLDGVPLVADPLKLP